MKIMPTILSLTNLINNAFRYVIETSETYKIDESHALKHSMEVYGFAKKIYESELCTNPYLEEQQQIIYMAAIGHDMCDKKYMNEKEGIEKYKFFLSENMSSNDIEVTGKIIETMSYSKVKVNGYPNLNEYQLAYHIVREADLLTAYDIDRCVIYGMFVEKLEYNDALKRAIKLFESRVLTYKSDDLFITQYSKEESLKKHIEAEKELDFIKKSRIL
jgi:HD superfamily phosphodiesterase